MEHKATTEITIDDNPKKLMDAEEEYEGDSQPSTSFFLI